MGPGILKSGSGRYIWVLSQAELGIGKMWSVGKELNKQMPSVES